MSRSESSRIPLPFVADVRAREVALHGTADFAFWRDRLAAEQLVPVAEGGRARVTVSGISSRFWGMPFCELVVVVWVAPTPGAAGRDGVYLAHAFNTSRLFAWCERRFFKTPYSSAPVTVATGPPACLRLGPAGEHVDLARRAEAAPAATADELWEGPVYLPRRGRDPGLVFFARLGGSTSTFPYVPGTDRLVLRPRPELPVLGWLADSGFAGGTWAVRADARHARTETVTRVRAFEGRARGG